MASAVLVAKWPQAVGEHGKILRTHSLKFTGNVVGDPLIPGDNARYESTAVKHDCELLKRVPQRPWFGGRVKGRYLGLRRRRAFRLRFLPGGVKLSGRRERIAMCTIQRILQLGFLVLVFAPYALPCPNPTNCLNCIDECQYYAGWTNSPQMGNCSWPKDCRVLAPAQRSYLDSLHPGMFVHVEREALIVAGVIPGSAADKAGIVPGDQILLLNGEDPRSSCSARAWPSIGDPNSADVLLAHGRLRRRIRLALAPIRELLGTKLAAAESGEGASHLLHALAATTPPAAPEGAVTASVF